MTCTRCGVEIADKALICYRCGAATAPARRAAATTPAVRRRPDAAAVVALIALVMAALFLGTTTDGEAPRLVGWALLALGVLAAALHLAQRRRR
jgi:hypothetical protein